MRLSALARRIEQTPTRLISFLEKNGVEPDNGINTVLNPEIVDLVLEKFAPDEAKSVEIETVEEHSVEIPLVRVSDQQAVEEESDANRTSEDINSAEQAEKEIESEAMDSPRKKKVGTIEDLEGDSKEDIDLIKIKKVKLEGIKVVGKIELPEKPRMEKDEKQPEEETAQTKGSEKSSERPKTRSGKFNRNRKKIKPGKGRKPRSYEEKLKEEERQKLKKRRRRELEEKQRKRKYYEKNLKPKMAGQVKKKKKRKTADTLQATEQEIIVHKNPLRRLWAWLNGAYDRY